MNPALAVLVVLAMPTRMRQGLDAYEFGDWPKACSALTEARTDRTLTDADRRDLLRYLGACHHVQGELEPAREAFSALLDSDPQASLDPVVFPPEMVAFFRDLETSRAVAAPTSSPVSPAPARSRWRAVAPFGLGQFQNGQDTKGVVFAATEGVALATGVVGLAVFESSKKSGSFLGGGEFDDPDAADTLQLVYGAGFAAFGVLWVAGAVDALVHLQDPPTSALVPTPGGAAWVGRF